MERVGTLSALWALAWPAVIRNTLNCASDRFTLIFVGHWDDSRVHYDGAGLGACSNDKAVLGTSPGSMRLEPKQTAYAFLIACY